MLSTMYAAGPRVSEVANLKVEDIDSGRGILWIRGGKGRKDRRTLLPPKLLELLRVYWRWELPKDWLFPGEKPGTPISKESIFRACQKAGQDAGISKAVHPHSLRHAFATHCWKPGWTSAPFSFCSAMPTWKPPPAICMSPTPPYAPPSARWNCWTRSMWSRPPAHFDRSDERAPAGSGRRFPRLWRQLSGSVGSRLIPPAEKSLP